MYADSLIGCSVKCTINKPTRITDCSETLLDHVYTNNPNNKYLSGITLSADLSDHLGTFISVPTKKLNIIYKEPMLIRDMSKFDTKFFLEDLSAALDMLYFNEKVCVNENFEKFVSVFTETINNHAPMRRASRKEKKIKSKPWLSSSLLKSIRKKNQLFQKYLKTKNSLVSSEYKAYRNTLNRTINGAKRMHYHELLKDNKGDSNKIWKIVNELASIKTKARVDPTELITENGKILTNSDEIAESLNEHFVNIGPKMAESISSADLDGISYTKSFTSTKINNSFFLAPSTTNEIINIIDSLSAKKATRSKDVETKFLKLSQVIIAPILSKLFNMCFKSGVFPNCLKVAEVVPIFKKGDQSKATNYRPISLLSQFDKILEKIIYHRLIHFLEKYHLLNKTQFGFRQNSSTIHAISKIYDQLLQNIDKDLYTCCIFLDLSKAFDTVNHTILLEKLYRSFGIRGVAHELFRSYLTDRLQCTVVSNSVSCNRPVRCGIPQGSCLGPLLFLLYVNDLPNISQFHTTLFADDTLLMLADKNLETLETKVNEQIRHVDYWLCKIKLSLNYTKTNCLLIHKQQKKNGA